MTTVGDDAPGAPIRSRTLAIAFAGTLPISFSAIFFRLSEASPITAGFFRMAYALPVLAVMWLVARHRDHRTLRLRLLAGVAGMFLGLDVIAWQMAVDHIGAGLATLIANTQVVIVPIATWWVFRERPANRVFVAMPVVLGGLGLITGLGRADSFGEDPVLGAVFGCVAAILYSGFLVMFRRSNRGLAPTQGVLLDAVIGATLITVVAGALTGDLDLVPSWPSHGWLLALALGGQVVGWMAISHALPRLPAAHTSFAIILQPTLTLVWGRMIFGEDASGVQLGGVLLVLAGIALATLPDTRRPVPTR